MGIFSGISKAFSKVFRPVLKGVANTVLKPVARVVGGIAEKPIALAQKAIQTVGDIKNLPVVGGLIRKGVEELRQGKAGGFLKGVVGQLDKSDERLGKVRGILDDPSRAISEAGRASGGRVGRAIGEIFQ
jgi:hypothetical protein